MWTKGCCLVSVGVCVMLVAAPRLSLGRDEQWEQWKSTYGKRYKDDAEEQDHRIIWRQNRCMIEAHNREAEQGQHSYSLELNHRGDMGSLDMEILKKMVDETAENSVSDEVLEETSSIIDDYDQAARNCMLDEMIEVMDEFGSRSKTDILSTMSDKMRQTNKAVTKLILREMKETLSDYDPKAQKHILAKMEQTLTDYNRMSRKLVENRMAATMESGRTSLSDILGDMTEAIDESRSVSKKLILEELAEILADYNKTDSQKKQSLLPKALDHREEGLVTRVRDQGNCGSCWAFSAAGALEGQLAKMTDQLLELSPQNLIDCDLQNNGCDGGHMSLAFKYVMENAGVNAEEDYSYAGREQNCRYKPSAVAAKCKGFKMIPEGDEQALATALFEVGPLSVAINVESRKFQFYKSGVYYNPDCVPHSRDHAMLLVGYGETAQGQKYWIVKNSWGERWGEQGYVRIARNHGNHCGIASEASYPLME